METQTIINVAIAVAGFFGGWVLNRLTQAIDRLDNDVRKLPIEYVSKDDYHRDIGEIKGMFKAIFEKLDSKADKS